MGESSSRNVASLNILVHDAINSYYILSLKIVYFSLTDDKFCLNLKLDKEV